MAKKFLADNQTTSDPIFPLTNIIVKMVGDTTELTNWILECADRDDVLENDDSWVQSSANDYDWSLPGNAVEDFPCSRDFAYRLRRTTGDAAATATWGHVYSLVWR